MFARLRGIPEKNIKAAVQTEINRLDLNKYANKRCGTYRSVSKRGIILSSILFSLSVVVIKENSVLPFLSWVILLFYFLMNLPLAWIQLQEDFSGMF